VDPWRRAAPYVDRIRGAKPSELPVQFLKKANRCARISRLSLKSSPRPGRALLRSAMPTMRKDDPTEGIKVRLPKSSGTSHLDRSRNRTVPRLTVNQCGAKAAPDKSRPDFVVRPTQSMQMLATAFDINPANTVGHAGRYDIPLGNGGLRQMDGTRPPDHASAQVHSLPQL
jgi:hypothetical protein